MDFYLFIIENIIHYVFQSKIIFFTCLISQNISRHTCLNSHTLSLTVRMPFLH